MSSNWTQAKETSLMMNSTKTQRQWHSAFPASHQHHLHAAQLLTTSLQACSGPTVDHTGARLLCSLLWFFKSLNYVFVRIPHCSCQIYTWSQHCRAHVCRLQSEASAVAPRCTYDKAWGCKQPLSHLTMLTLTNEPLWTLSPRVRIPNTSLQAKCASAV